MTRRAGGAAMLLVVVAITVSACDLLTLPQPASALSGPADALLVTVEASGGMCAPGACSTRSDVRRDGSIVRSDGARGVVDPDVMRRLEAAIDAADWPAILARPFTGTCPTAYDGQELTYTFQTGRGPVSIASCTTRIDPGQEPFSTLGAALLAVGS